MSCRGAPVAVAAAGPRSSPLLLSPLLSPLLLSPLPAPRDKRSGE
ncbi:hypothetical protein [uncultured Microbacterium sp.]|nr:hypothetical protein [uncultured Microbacterium sp.]